MGLLVHFPCLLQSTLYEQVDISARTIHHPLLCLAVLDPSLDALSIHDLWRAIFSCPLPIPPLLSTSLAFDPPMMLVKPHWSALHRWGGSA